MSTTAVRVGLVAAVRAIRAGRPGIRSSARRRGPRRSSPRATGACTSRLAAVVGGVGLVRVGVRVVRRRRGVACESRGQERPEVRHRGGGARGARAGPRSAVSWPSSGGTPSHGPGSTACNTSTTTTASCCSTRRHAPSTATATRYPRTCSTRSHVVRRRGRGADAGDASRDPRVRRPRRGRVPSTRLTPGRHRAHGVRDRRAHRAPQLTGRARAVEARHRRRAHR